MENKPPIIPIEIIDRVTALKDKFAFGFDFRDLNGNAGSVVMTAPAFRTLQIALSKFPSTTAEGAIPTVEVRGVTNVSFDAGGPGLLLGLSDGTNLLVRIPSGIVPGFRAKLVELDRLDQPGPAKH